MEKNKRIYYILMAATIVAVVLTALACIVITDGSLLYTLAIVAPLALVEALVFMMLHFYPILCERAEQSEKKRKRRVPYVPDPMGFRWVASGVTSLGFSLIVLCLTLALIDQITWLAFALLATALLAATYAANLYLTIRIYNIVGRPVRKRIAWEILLEAVDVVVDFFTL